MEDPQNRWFIYVYVLHGKFYCSMDDLEVPPIYPMILH